MSDINQPLMIKAKSIESVPMTNFRCKCKQVLVQIWAGMTSSESTQLEAQRLFQVYYIHFSVVIIKKKNKLAVAERGKTSNVLYCCSTGLICIFPKLTGKQTKPVNTYASYPSSPECFPHFPSMNIVADFTLSVDKRQGMASVT